MMAQTSKYKSKEGGRSDSKPQAGEHGKAEKAPGVAGENLKLAEMLGMVGIPVFPFGNWVIHVESNKRWRQQASADPTKIAKMWEGQPDMPPCIPLGRVGLIVIECDRRDSRRAAGVKVFEQIAEEHRFSLKDHPVMEVESPLGRMEKYYFRLPEGRTINIRPDTWPLGFRALDYAMILGDRYRWSLGRSSKRLDVAYMDKSIPTMPDWLIDIVEGTVGSGVVDGSLGPPVEEAKRTSADPILHEDGTSGSQHPEEPEEVREIDDRLSVIAEVLDNASKLVLEYAELTAEWVRLVDRRWDVSGQHVHKPQGGRPESGTARAARELSFGGKTEGARRKWIERAILIDSISTAGKAAARKAGLADNQRALLEIAKEPTPEVQVAKARAIADQKRAPRSKPIAAAEHDDEAMSVDVTTPSLPAATDGLAALMAAWANATAPERERFKSVVFGSDGPDDPVGSRHPGEDDDRAHNRNEPDREENPDGGVDGQVVTVGTPAHSIPAEPQAREQAPAAEVTADNAPKTADPTRPLHTDDRTGLIPGSLSIWTPSDALENAVYVTDGYYGMEVQHDDKKLVTQILGWKLDRPLYGYFVTGQENLLAATLFDGRLAPRLRRGSGGTRYVQCLTDGVERFYANCDHQGYARGIHPHHEGVVPDWVALEIEQACGVTLKRAYIVRSPTGRKEIPSGAPSLEYFKVRPARSRSRKSTSR